MPGKARHRTACKRVRAVLSGLWGVGRIVVVGAQPTESHQAENGSQRAFKPVSISENLIYLEVTGRTLKCC